MGWRRKNVDQSFAYIVLRHGGRGVVPARSRRSRRNHNERIRTRNRQPISIGSQITPSRLWRGYNGVNMIGRGVAARPAPIKGLKLGGAPRRDLQLLFVQSIVRVDEVVAHAQRLPQLLLLLLLLLLQRLRLLMMYDVRVAMVRKLIQLQRKNSL